MLCVQPCKGKTNLSQHHSYNSCAVQYILVAYLLHTEYFVYFYSISHKFPHLPSFYKFYSVGKDEEKRTFVHCWWECKLVQPITYSMENIMEVFLPKLKMELWAILLPGIYFFVFNGNILTKGCAALLISCHSVR